MLTIVYRDNLGIVEQTADFNCIDFLDGECIFSVDYEEYRIPIENLIEITVNWSDLILFGGKYNEKVKCEH